MEVAELEEGSDDGENQRIKFVIGANGLKGVRHATRIDG